MKKLIPALCMLLVAACLMGTSTYAWFAANEDVTASGMSVKAAADGGLAIATYTGNVGTAPIAPAANTFGSAATASWTNIAAGASIKPTSTSAGVWYSASAASIEDYEADDDGYTKVAEYPATADGFLAYATTGLGSYAQIAKFQIKSMDTDNAARYTLKVSEITVTAPTDSKSATLNNAIRVAVKCGDTWAFFSPAYTADNTFNFVAAGTAPVVGVSTAHSDAGVKLNGSTATGNGVAISSTLSNQAMDVEVYVYYEGEDENCKTEAIRLGVDTLAVSIKFSATKNS